MYRPAHRSPITRHGYLKFVVIIKEIQARVKMQKFLDERDKVVLGEGETEGRHRGEGRLMDLNIQAGLLRCFVCPYLEDTLSVRLLDRAEKPLQAVVRRDLLLPVFEESVVTNLDPLQMEGKRGEGGIKSDGIDRSLVAKVDLRKAGI